jgi:hypothetical protein
MILNSHWSLLCVQSIIGLTLRKQALGLPWGYIYHLLYDRVLNGGSSFGIVTVYSQSSLETEVRFAAGDFSLLNRVRTDVGPTESPIHSTPGSLFMEVKRPKHEAGSLHYRAEIKNGWNYTSTPPYFFTAWHLITHREKFTFYMYKIRSLRPSVRHILYRWNE